MSQQDSRNEPSDALANEAERLEVLLSYQVLDTSPEQGFDDIVRLAARSCETPVALVSLVESDRQWFKARVGFEPCETPLDQSVCKLALGSHDLLIIPDLSRDARTISNPLVTSDPKIRFYAGAPLITAEGLVLGTICVIDHLPRPGGLTADQAEDLRALARQVMALLDARKALISRNALVERLDQLNRRVVDEQMRLTSMFEQAPSFMALLRGPEHVFELANPSYRRLIGDRVVDGKTVAEALPDAAAQGYVGILDWVFATGEPFLTKGAPFSMQQQAGGPVVELYLDFVYQPVRSANGSITGIFVEGSDVTDRVQQGMRLTALAKLGERLRDVNTIGEIAEAASQCLAEAIGGSRTGFGRVDLSDETIQISSDWCSPGTPSVAGLHHFRTFGSYIENLRRGETVAVTNVCDDPRTADGAQALLNIQIQALLNLPILEQGNLALVVFVHRANPHQWTSSELDLVRQVGDRTHLAMARVLAEEHQAVLNLELSHRLKNTLAIVQAIARQTLRQVSERDAVDAFSERIAALSRAHDVLMHQSWTAAGIEEVATAVLSTFEQPDRFVLSGPALRIGPRATLSLSLLLHELATNASKYGAISVPGGRVGIDWRIEGAGEDSILHMRWQEVGGPVVSEPSGAGFGSRLIRMGLIGTGGVEISYNSSGVTALMQAQLSQLQQP